MGKLGEDVAADGKIANRGAGERVDEGAATVLAPRSAGVRVRTLQIDLFFSNHAGREATPVGGQLGQRINAQQHVVVSARMDAGSALTVAGWCVDQSSASRVQLVQSGAHPRS